MKQNDEGGRLSLVSSNNLQMYSLDGVKLDLNKTLCDYCTQSAEKDTFKFIMDFEDVIIIRLLGGDKWIYVPINDFQEIKTTSDLKG